ncbi:4-hydroxythreonine-4-phosphate dehydrogenase PdxA [Sulfitobacter sp. KE29]|uniref:4-hydroxythreonine-4-phosphate dehydrogenase PdxA n=1 Tax=Sulfitobacter TaxID=60136 RepID=UPI0007C394D2|nr:MULTISPECIES: 4-hydroxythreonine-4-phosphate dehydrogenase PdxA [Sulfitobacter]KZY52395.1 4-hydroxythreonine-4-phosphate dehydrogenase [Sulfitobacter sp. HI0054]MBO9440397.1 4-hydroxythreonine-4-phosphate dehydrogenase PdxA [Sulfitobacter sp. R18_2]MDF3419634.1 4-hydroxythreonine-4-phosphate dehydrogenase PdxA [Sulfitobacter sp. Ks38]MDF3427117.1 4-hydroxythreonine-4-phosphate dehydrogenase PdxA [Sulfitobacter sp. KE29]MDF3430698.1 4-hydroxythreonine-4-phosphate dehydrogenase PdxA [Sulfitob
MTPRIGVIPGDPSGIGPELVARLLADDCCDQAQILLIGDRHVFETGQRQAGCDHAMTAVDAAAQDWTETAPVALHEMQTIAPGDVVIGQSTEASGRSTLQVLDQALAFVQEGVIDAIVFAPFNKASMHMAGIGHSDELHYIAEKLGVTNYISELNTLDDMWTSRVTSHIALRDVADTITPDRIQEATRLIDRTLRQAGHARPRIAVAALNPHAGDGGNFGREEIDVIEPAVRHMAGGQMAVTGPLPSDTVFLKVTRGEIDAVVTMYHDQGQIALKLLGFDRGVTVQGGLPVPVTTPAHGTAFDIAGQGNADVGATRAAFEIACKMVRNSQKETAA